MKSTLLFGCIGLLLLSLTGCESLGDSFGDRVREKFNPPSEVRTYAADQKEVYQAARTSLEKLGFRIVRGGAAQGILEAVSGVQAEDSLHSSRQVTAKVRLSKALEGGTELRVQMTEVLEDESTGGAGMGTQTPLHGTSLYAVFLRGVSQALGLPQKD